MLVNHQNVFDLGSANMVFWYTMYISQKAFCCFFPVIHSHSNIRYCVYADRITQKSL